jgi:ABC-type multidrug transport system fused ATPase/permease subunit
VRSGRRLLVPEVIQSSALDCGPAALKALAEGFGIPVSYGRLREACQTGIDGTSIDAVESVARHLGLDAEQVMLPADHLLLPEANALPAVVVVRNPGGMTHFVVAWGMMGGRVQVMDPATGRRFPARRRFVSDLYLHGHPVPTMAWREWARSDEFIAALRARLARLGVRAEADVLIAVADADPGWRAPATLDAAARLTASLVAAGGVRAGPEAARALRALLDDALAAPEGAEPDVLPPSAWMVRPHPPADDGEERLLLRGAVLVRVRSRLERRPSAAAAPPTSAQSSSASPETPSLATTDSIEMPSAIDVAISPEPFPGLRMAPEERSRPPGRRLLSLLAEEGALAPAALGVALAAAAGGVVMEALLFRGLLDFGRELGSAPARAGLALALVLLCAVMLAIDWAAADGLRRAGRHLEARLRVAFLRKLPRLGDRYFHSRLTSDMAERAHSAHVLRMLPSLGGSAVRAAAELLAVTAAIAWIDPASALPAVIGAVAAVAVPLVMHRFVAERDLRVRSHQGALGRFYLDALLGLVPVRAHGAERNVRREHELLVAEWARAGLGLFRALSAADAVAGLAGYGVAAWIILAHAARSGASGSLVLLAYWALSLPALGQSLALLLRQLPVHRNVALRLFETLDASEEEAAAGDGSLDGAVGAAGPARQGDAIDAILGVSTAGDAARSREGVGDGRATRPADAAGHLGSADGTPGASQLETPLPEAVVAPRGVAIEMRGVRVEAAGTAILHGVDLAIEPGSHVAVVGPSGAGKSTLVGLLLGWHRPARGEVRVDGAHLDAAALRALRARTAWVDPAVQLWNRSAAENLAYGAAPGPLARLGAAVDAAGLRDVVRRLPQGLQTPLGEGGALVSGGEGQRVRFARAWLRGDARLVVLDEPFRGLDRERRRALLAEARRAWRGATLLCVTHDVAETAGFDRVLVVADGAIAEDGAPAELASRAGSRYAALLAAEAEVRARFVRSPGWRRLRLTAEGALEEAGDPEAIDAGRSRAVEPTLEITRAELSLAPTRVRPEAA